MLTRTDEFIKAIINVSFRDCKGTDPLCCEYGIEYAEEIVYNVKDDDIVRDHPTYKCHAKAYSMSKHMLSLPTKCIVAFYRSCLDQVEWRISGILFEHSFGLCYIYIYI